MANIYESDNYEPARSVAALIGLVRSEMLAALDRELTGCRNVADIGVTAAQFVVISRLAAAEKQKSASDLCKEMSYDAGAMTRMIDRLEGKDLVRRVRCTDNRATIVQTH